MRKGFGLLLILTLILTLGTIVQNYRFDSSAALERSSALALQQEAASVEVALADLRAAQAAYLAVGQDHRFWISRAADLTTQIVDGLGRLSAGTSSAEAGRHYDAARTALTDLGNVDRRARDFVNADQRGLASDIVFVEGLAATQRLQSELLAARQIEGSSSEARLVRNAQLGFGMTALVLGFVFLVAWRAARALPQTPVSEPASTAQMIRDLPPPVKAPNGNSPGTAVRVTAPILPPSVNLPGAAELCVDLARVIDSRDVPALLERAAQILDAKGVILWVANADGSSLRPSLSFGYPDKVIQRLGGLPADSENVTSQAFRSMRPQIMNGAMPGAAGAVAVPLVTGSGCVGVLSAETRLVKPAPESVAVARIIAAQFAALVGPADEAAGTHAESHRTQAAQA
jgi:hypothetical protein